MPSYPTTPSFPLTFPVTPKFSEFRMFENWKTPVSESPFTGDRQVFKYPGSNRLAWEAKLPPMKNGDSDVDVWVKFLLDLQGLFGTFTLDLHAHVSTIEYVKGFTGLPTVWSSPVEQNWHWTRQRAIEGLVIRGVEP